MACVAASLWASPATCTSPCAVGCRGMCCPAGPHMGRPAAARLSFGADGPYEGWRSWGVEEFRGATQEFPRCPVMPTSHGPFVLAQVAASHLGYGRVRRQADNMLLCLCSKHSQG